MIACARSNKTGQLPAITILLVDDDEDCRMLVRDAIAGSDVQNRVFEVCNAEEAMRFLRRQAPYENAPQPGLIFLDIEMPGMDGLSVLRQIKEDPKLKEITTVMMTGVSDERHMRVAAAAGANSYTIKPTDAGLFLKTVMDSTNYWLTIHQYPERQHPEAA